NPVGGKLRHPVSSPRTIEARVASFVPSLWTVTSTVVGFPSIAVEGLMSAVPTTRSGHTNRVTAALPMLFRSFSSRKAPGSSGLFRGASTTIDTWTVVSATPAGVHVTHARAVDFHGRSGTV